MDDCSIPGCGRPAFRFGLCFGHAKRKQRGQSVAGPLRRDRGENGQWVSPDVVWEEVHEAILAYQDAETDREHAARLAALVALLHRWTVSGCPGAHQSTSEPKMRAKVTT